MGLGSGPEMLLVLSLVFKVPAGTRGLFQSSSADHTTKRWVRDLPMLV